MNILPDKPRLRVDARAGLAGRHPAPARLHPRQQPRRGRRRAARRARPCRVPLRPARPARHRVSPPTSPRTPSACWPASTSRAASSATARASWSPRVADASAPPPPSAAGRLRDVLRVEDGRYWSYLCTDPACCPAEALPFDPAAHPAAQAMAARRSAGAGRAGTRWPPRSPRSPGRCRATMRKATRRAERTAARLITRRRAAGAGPAGPGRGAGGDQHLPRRRVAHPGRPACAGWRWSCCTCRSAMTPGRGWTPSHRDAHRRLWTDVVRRAQPGYVAAPASLLAFTAWQAGDGALANIALDRALADDPGLLHGPAAARTITDAGTAAVDGGPADDPRRSRRQLRRPPPDGQAPAATPPSHATAADRLPRARAGSVPARALHLRSPLSSERSHDHDQRDTASCSTGYASCWPRPRTTSVTPPEAEALTAKAAELMAKYGIDRALLAAAQPDTDAPASRLIDIDNPWGRVKAHLLCGLGVRAALPVHHAHRAGRGRGSTCSATAPTSSAWTLMAQSDIRTVRMPAADTRESDDRDVSCVA